MGGGFFDSVFCFCFSPSLLVNNDPWPIFWVWRMEWEIASEKRKNKTELKWGVGDGWGYVRSVILRMRIEIGGLAGILYYLLCGQWWKGVT